MSTSSFSHHSPPPELPAEASAPQHRIKLTIKPLKAKSSTTATPAAASDGASRSNSPAVQPQKNTITIKPLKIKASRSNSVVEDRRAVVGDEEKIHVPKLKIKPPKLSRLPTAAPAPVKNEDEDAMEVDISTPQIDAAQSAPSGEEPAPEESPMEILSSHLPLNPPPPKPKAPRPVKLKPLKEILRRLITIIKKKDDYAFFLSPVDTSQVPGYLDVIKEPMDFGTMTEKIERGQYRSLEQFKDDFLLVTANAKLFNPPPSLYHTEASKIESWGLDQITKASTQVIEYETDWNIDIVADEGPASIMENATDQGGTVAATGDLPLKTRSPSVMSSAVGTPGALAERSKRTLRGKKVPMVTESWEDHGHLPGTKDGLGAFPACSDLAALMIELKLRGKRFTKKERLKREKEGPPYGRDGSLDYYELEHPFGALQQLVPKPLNVPELLPLIPIGTTPSNPAMRDRELSQPPEERKDVTVEEPIALPPDQLPEILSDPNRHVFVDPPSSTSTVGNTQLRHWTITRNPPRPTRAREEEEDGVAAGTQAKRRRTVHTDYGSFATLLGTIAAEQGLKVDDFEMFRGDEKILEQIRQSIQSRDPVSLSKSDANANPDVENRERVLDADEYIRDVVYGGVDGLAYFRSLAEFVGEYHGPINTEQEADVPFSSGKLGMPLAQWVETHVVNPLTLGNHATLRAAAETLARANAQDKSDMDTFASHAISQYLALANEDKSAKLEQLRELEALSGPTAPIDIAPLLRKPEELFLAENEWAVLKREEKRDQATATSLAVDPTRISNANAGTGAMLGLDFASALPGQSRLAGAVSGDTPASIEHALTVGAETLRHIARRISEKGLENEIEDPEMRRARLTLIALAKRAPLDRIARLPPELVPMHIRHIVPTMGT